MKKINGRVSNATKKTSPQGVIKVRNEWYRDSFKKIATILLVSASLNVIFGILIGYRYLNPTQPKYFATNDAGQIIPIVALSEPNLSSSAIIQFASDAARNAYSFNFSNYKDRLNAVGAKYFTPRGFDDFVNAVNESGNLEAVKKKRLIVRTITTGIPSIGKRGVLNGIYTWYVEVPVKIMYKGSASEYGQDKIIAMTIQRRSALKSSKGLGVVQFLVK